MNIGSYDREHFESDEDIQHITQASSNILQWYQSVQPLNGPEDVRELREKFERGAAEEALSRAAE